MRDPNRIPEILDELGRVWMENPDWRLGQILANGLRPPGHPGRGEETSWLFYTEDDDVLEALRNL